MSKRITKVSAELKKLEVQLADSITHFARLIAPLPIDRDSTELEVAAYNIASSRRKLSIFVHEVAQSIADASSDRIAQRKAKELQSKLDEAQSSLQHWGKCEQLVFAQVKSSRNALLVRDASPRQDAKVMDHVTAMFLDALHKIANPAANMQSDRAYQTGLHGDIPLPMIQFSEMIGAAFRICLAQRRRAPLRFLDVGSGGGTKVLAATACFDECTGIEFEKDVVESGSAFLQILAPDAARLVHADALSYMDFDTYDVVYMYRPIAEFERMVELEKHIVSQSTRGTVLLAAGGLRMQNLDEKQVQELAEDIYVTGYSATEASQLKEAAEHMGTAVPGYGRKRQRKLGCWQTLVDASARNGHFFC